jgi:hypothetical protein
MTSHHCQSGRQPSTVTVVLPRSQVTVGKLFAGPARTFTELVVVAVAAVASGAPQASASADRSGRRMRIGFLRR